MTDNESKPDAASVPLKSYVDGVLQAAAWHEG
jgi:hypothetical protein